MKKELFILSLVTIFSATQMAYSEEKKAEKEGTEAAAEYVPYNNININYQYNYSQYQQMYGYGSRAYIHDRIELLTTMLRFDQEKDRIEMDSAANSALWSFYNADASLDFPKEQLKKYSEIFKTEDGKTNIATRLTEINSEIKKLGDETFKSEGKDWQKEYDARIAKRTELLNEGKTLYKQLAEKLKKEETLKLAEALNKDAVALPEVKAQFYSGFGGMGRAHMPVGSYPMGYGMGGGFGGLGAGYYNPHNTQTAAQMAEEIRAYEAYLEEMKKRSLKQSEEIQEQVREIQREAGERVLKEYYKSKNPGPIGTRE